jgi:hypothetical protein
MGHSASVVAERQRPLHARYVQNPSEAITTKSERSVHAAARDPFHGAVEAIGDDPAARWEFGQSICWQAM